MKHKGTIELDRTTFSKTRREKQELREARIKHNKMLIAAGHSPKKRLNLGEPNTMRVTL